MNVTDLWSAEALRGGVDSLGWCLLHFLWQGVLIAGALELLLTLTRGRSSELRYMLRCAAMLAMAAAPLITYFMIERADLPPALAIASADSAEQAVSAFAGLMPWVVLAWALGAALLGSRLARGYLRVRRLNTVAPGSCLGPAWSARFDALSKAVGVSALARVIEGTSLSAPTVVGWIKPVVLLPARIFTGLTTEQVEALIVHELAHVRRHDYLVNLVQSALEALLFYHPAVWWVSRGIRAEREYCCDDVAVRVTRDGVSYARALTTLESWRGEAPSLGMSTLGGSLMHRIQRLIGVQPGRAHGRRSLSAVGALLVALTMGATAYGLVSAGAPQNRGADEVRAAHDEVRARLAEIDRQLEDVRRLLAESRALRDNLGKDGGQGHLVEVQERRNRVHESLRAHMHASRNQPGRTDERRVDDVERLVRESVRGTGPNHPGAQDRTHQLHEHLQQALKEHRIAVDGSNDWTGAIHERVQQALKAHGIDADGSNDWTGAIHERVQRALKEHGVDANLSQSWTGAVHEYLQRAPEAHGRQGAASEEWTRKLQDTVQRTLERHGVDAHGHDGDADARGLHERWLRNVEVDADDDAQHHHGGHEGDQQQAILKSVHEALEASGVHGLGLDGQGGHQIVIDGLGSLDELHETLRRSLDSVDLKELHEQVELHVLDASELGVDVRETLRKALEGVDMKALHEQAELHVLDASKLGVDVHEAVRDALRGLESHGAQTEKVHGHGANHVEEHEHEGGEAHPDGSSIERIRRALSRTRSV